jgi:predicted nucleic acid-binding protein
VIIADTGAIVALIDADDRHHARLTALFENDPAEWVLPWSILPEVDYLLSTHVGQKAEEAFLYDLSQRSLFVEWGQDQDLVRAEELCRKYRALRLGLVDATVMSIAERLRASAIATLDNRHFGAVSLRRKVKLLPRYG